MNSLNNSSSINHLDMKLYYCGSQCCSPGHSWGPAVKEHFKIHYIHKGKGTFRLGDKTYNLKSGEGFLICPNVISYYEADKEDPWQYSWCAFDGLNVETYLRRANLTKENPIFLYNKDDEVSRCFEQMVEVGSFERSRDLRQQSLLYLFLAIITDEASNYNAAEEAKTNKNIYINKVIDYIQFNYSHKIKISEIAKYIGLDRKYLSLLFKSSVGITIQDYLLNFRLDKAKLLLRDTSLSIGDVARSVGYDDPLIFSKMFKKTVGLSPSEYRKIK